MTLPDGATTEMPTEPHGQRPADARIVNVRTVVALAVVVLATAALPLGDTLLAPLAPELPRLDADLAARLRYQLAALPLAAVVVAAVAWLVPGSRRFLRIGRLDALVEETITRFGVVGTLAGRLPPRAVYLASGALFGTAHYWGVPGGLAGVAVAGFLGWLLAKSIGETGGLGWAWFLHLLQDIVIFSALFAAVP